MSGDNYITKYYYSEKALNTEPLFLSVFVSPASFIYSVSTNNFKNVIELCHVEITHHITATFNITDKISFLVNNYLLHKRKFERINICFLSTEFTTIPEAFAVESEIKSMLKFSTGSDKIKRTFHHRVKSLYFSFAFDQELAGYFEKTFPNASLRHAGAVCLSLFFSQHSLINSNFYLNIQDGYIELAVKEKNDLLVYNVFNYSNNEDILYYLLFMMEQFQLNPLYVKLAIAVQRDVHDDLIKSIKKYIKQVDFCVTDPSINLNGDLSKLPKHYYFTLLNQHLCEL